MPSSSFTGNDNEFEEKEKEDGDNAVVHLGFAVPAGRDDDESDKDEDKDEKDDNENDGTDIMSIQNCGWNLCHSSHMWSEWDGGKIGGRPSWLNPRDVPLGPLRCRGPCSFRSSSSSSSSSSSCASVDSTSNSNGSGSGSGTGMGSILSFLCQIYCPADDDDQDGGGGGKGKGGSNPGAFHRTLYAFACPSHLCASSFGPDTVTILRCQLSRTNDFYPYSCDDDDGDGDDDSDDSRSTTQRKEAKGGGMGARGGSSTNNNSVKSKQRKEQGGNANRGTVRLCAVCNLGASGKCPKQNLWFCCREHQMEHLRWYKATTTAVEKNKSYQKKGNDKLHRNVQSGCTNEQGQAISSLLPSVLNEWELVVEDEPPPAVRTASLSQDSETNDDNNNNNNKRSKDSKGKDEEKGDAVQELHKRLENKLALFQHDESKKEKERKKQTKKKKTEGQETGKDKWNNEDDDDDIDDAKLTQSDLNELTLGKAAMLAGAGTSDPITLAFYDRIGRGNGDVKDQCLRYCRWKDNDTNVDKHDDDNEEEEVEKQDKVAKRDDMNNSRHRGRRRQRRGADKVADKGDGSGDDHDNDDNDDDVSNCGPLWISSSNRLPSLSLPAANTASSYGNANATKPAVATTMTATAATTTKKDASLPPPCPNCGSARKFEFQIMPQMLHFLHGGNGKVVTPTTTATTIKNGNHKDALEALKAYADIKDRAEAEGRILPPEFHERYEHAKKEARDKLLFSNNHVFEGVGTNNRGGEQGGNANINGKGTMCLDFGTVVVYTCTASCDIDSNGGSDNNDDGNGNGDDGMKKKRGKMGAYLEEWAWRQPPLSLL